MSTKRSSTKRAEGNPVELTPLSVLLDGMKFYAAEATRLRERMEELTATGDSAGAASALKEYAGVTKLAMEAAAQAAPFVHGRAASFTPESVAPKASAFTIDSTDPNEASRAYQDLMMGRPLSQVSRPPAAQAPAAPIPEMLALPPPPATTAAEEPARAAPDSGCEPDGSPASDRDAQPHTRPRTTGDVMTTVMERMRAMSAARGGNIYRGSGRISL